MLNKQLRVMGLSTTLVIATLACGFLSNAQEKVATVDEAVSLLQAIDDNSTWSSITDGIDALDNQRQGYQLAAHFRERPLSDTSAGAALNDQSITVRVDAEAHALIEIHDKEQSSTFYVEDYRVSAEGSPAYRLEEGIYRCAWQEGPVSVLHGGPGGLFAEYGVAAAGARLLSVVERDESGDEAIAGRDALRYRIESRAADALDILSRSDNSALRAKLEAAGPFELSGALYLDEETLALLRYDSEYTDSIAQRRTEFVFEVTEWGSTSDIPEPPAAQIEVPCE